MRKRSSVRLYSAGILFAATSSISSLEAQDSDERYELTPFSVTGQGGDYKADTTLAATLVPSDLDDFGASIAVITEQFMEDLGSTDGESLLSMIGNMEVGGVQGNVSRVNEFNWSTNNARNNPQEEQRVRGLGSALLTRGFIRTNLPFDNYNTSQVTINRGQNSILYGFGSSGGVIDAATNRAQSDSQFGEVSFRFGHRGEHRQTLDLNQPIVERRLGLRISALNESLKFKQRPSFEKDKRFYGAWEAVPFTNDDSPFLGKLVFRGNYETGEILRNPPDVVPPTDAYSSWFNGIGSQEILNGVLAVPGISLDMIPNSAVKREWVLGAINAGLVDVPEDLTAEAYADIEGTFVPKTEYNRITEEGRDSFFGYTPYTFGPSLNYNSPLPNTRPGWSSQELGGVQGIMGRWRPDDFNVQDVRWTRQSTIGPGFSRHSLNDRHVFDYHNMLWQGTTNRVNTEFEARQFFIEQEFFDGKAGFVLAYDKQTREQSRFNALSSGESKAIILDVSSYHAFADSDFDGIADRGPNDNVGRPVAIVKDTATTDERTDWKTLRATAFAKWDANSRFNDSLGEILGSHTITGLYEEYAEDVAWRDRQGVWWADSGDVPAEEFISNGDNISANRKVISHIYLGTDARSLSDPSDLRIANYPTVRLPRPGDRYNIMYFDDRPFVDAGAVNEWKVIDSLSWGSRFRRTVDSKAINLQSHLLWDSIVTTVGLREDHQITQGRRTASQERGPTGSFALLLDDPGLNPTDGDFNEKILETLDREYISDTEGDTTTWSIVGHYPERFLGELPWGADLSIHYYEADSFDPDFGNVNIFNEVIPEPRNNSQEWGFTLNLWDDRLSLRFNRFETARTNDTTSLGGTVDRLLSEIDWYTYNIVLMEVFEGTLFPDPLDRELTPDTRPSNRQRRTGTDADLIGVNSFAEYYELLFSILPPSLQEIYGYHIAVQDERGTLLGREEASGPLAATQDTVARGTEVELAGRLGDQLSLALNIAQQETIRSNIGPVAIPVAFEMLQRIKDLGLYDIRDDPYLREQSTIGDWFEDVVRTIRIQKGQEGVASQEQREWRINLLARYDFYDGPLKGFSLGGALRYQDELVAGYPNRWDDFENAIPDVDNPFYGPEELNGDLFFRYTRPVNKNILWSLQFNARNLYRKNGDDDIPIAINPDGRVALIRIPNQQEFFLTNTFRF